MSSNKMFCTEVKTNPVVKATAHYIGNANGLKKYQNVLTNTVRFTEVCRLVINGCKIFVTYGQ